MKSGPGQISVQKSKFVNSAEFPTRPDPKDEAIGHFTHIVAAEAVPERQETMYFSFVRALVLRLRTGAVPQSKNPAAKCGDWRQRIGVAIARGRARLLVRAATGRALWGSGGRNGCQGKDTKRPSPLSTEWNQHSC